MQLPRHLATGSMLVLIAMAFAARARAEDTRSQNVLIGERALGMGGASTGLAEDPSAAFYNPAGLAHLSSTTLSASLSVYSFEWLRVENGYGSPVGRVDLSYEASPTLPVYVSAVVKLGRPDRFGIRSHALALSTFIPVQQTTHFAIDVTNQTTMVSDALRINESDRVLWFGPSYAYRLSRKWSFGLSAFLSTRSFSHTEDQTNFTAGAREPDGTYRNATLSVRESTAELRSKRLVFRLGATYRPTPRWWFGAMFQPPSIALSESSRTQERRFFGDQLAVPGYTTFFTSDQQDLPASSPIPWQLRLGAAYNSRGPLTLVADTWLEGPIGSSGSPVRAFGTPHIDPTTGETPQPGLFVAQSYRRTAVFNVAVGVETVIANMIPIRFGVFTNFSAAPAIDGPTDVYAHPDVDLFGASASVGFRAEGYDVSVGIAGVYGRGTGLGLNPVSGPTYVPVTIEEKTIYLVLTGERRALSRLAQDVYKEVTR